MHANSTVGQLAADAKVSHHKAAQTVTVGKAAPDLLDQVARGAMKLKDAVKQLPPRPSKRAASEQTAADTGGDRMA